VVGEQRWAVDSGGPELATAGTGDVLAGMVGALSSRGLGAEAASRSGAYWHGVAGGDLATTTAVTAEDLAVHVGRFAW
jgi:NAD(P)H-hydrate epimerase